MNSSEKKFQNILIILPRQLGDILLGSSLAFALRSEFPEARISWVAHPMGRQLLEGHPALTEVLYYPVQKSNPLKQLLRNPSQSIKSSLRHLWSEIKFLLRLRNASYDLVIDSICTPKTAIMSFSTRAPVRHGIATRWNRNWAYTWLSDAGQWKGVYAAKARLNLLSPVLGREKTANPPLDWLNSWMPTPPATRGRILNILSDLNLSAGQFIVLSPTSRRLLRQWPKTSFVELAVKLIEETGLKICWFWGPGEYEFTEELHKNLQYNLRLKNLDPFASCMPPLLSLAEAAHMSGLSAVWIGNTNGLSHVAVAGGARTVQIYGPTAPEPWLHPNTKKHASVQRNSGCIRCESNTCKTGTHECMKELSVDEVLNTVRRVISTQTSPST